MEVHLSSSSSSWGFTWSQPCIPCGLKVWDSKPFHPSQIFLLSQSYMSIWKDSQLIRNEAGYVKQRGHTRPGSAGNCRLCVGIADIITNCSTLEKNAGLCSLEVAPSYISELSERSAQLWISRRCKDLVQGDDERWPKMHLDRFVDANCALDHLWMLIVWRWYRRWWWNGWWLWWSLSCICSWW